MGKLCYTANFPAEFHALAHAAVLLSLCVTQSLWYSTIKWQADWAHTAWALPPVTRSHLPWFSLIRPGRIQGLLSARHKCKQSLSFSTSLDLPHDRVCPPQCQPRREETPDAYRCCVWSSRITAVLTWLPSLYQCCTSQTLPVNYWMWCGSS